MNKWLIKELRRFKWPSKKVKKPKKQVDDDWFRDDLARQMTNQKIGIENV